MKTDPNCAAMQLRPFSAIGDGEPTEVAIIGVVTQADLSSA